MTDTNEETPAMIEALVRDVIAPDAMVVQQCRTQIVMFRGTETQPPMTAAVLDVRGIVGNQGVELQLILSDHLAKHLMETWTAELAAAAVATIPDPAE